MRSWFTAYSYLLVRLFPFFSLFLKPLGDAALLWAPIVVVGIVRARWSCCVRQMLMWPLYALGGAAVRA